MSSCKYNKILKTKFQEKISTFNQIRLIKEIGKKIISPLIKAPKPNHIGDVVNSIDGNYPFSVTTESG